MKNLLKISFTLLFVNLLFLTNNLNAQVTVNNGWGKTHTWQDGTFNANWGSIIYRNGPIGIGTNNDYNASMLTVRSRSAQGFNNQQYNYNLVSEVKDNTERALAVKRGSGVTFRVDGDGRTYIGFDRPNTYSNRLKYMLWVDGAITCTKVKVQLTSASDWADYVFDKDYQLMPIKEIDQFVNQNHHLPNMPSAQELVDNEGVELLEITTKQQEKIEELFLYVIQLNKENDALKVRLSKLEE